MYTARYKAVLQDGGSHFSMQMYVTCFQWQKLQVAGVISAVVILETCSSPFITARIACSRLAKQHPYIAYKPTADL